jgi:hypothetical protein
MILNYLCPPALLYTVFTIIYLILEISNEKYHEAFVKAIIGIIFICILQAFCTMNLGIISWILVMIPIIFYTYMTLLFFFVFGLDPKDKDLSNNTVSKTCSKPKPTPTPKPAPAPGPAPGPAPAPAPAPAPTPQPKLEPYPVPDPSHWVPSKHKSSTPIKTKLYTLSVIPSDSWRDSPSYSPIIPDKSTNDTSDTNDNDTNDNDINDNDTNDNDKTLADFYKTINKELSDYNSFCSMYDKNTCSTYTACNFTNFKCVLDTPYQNKFNDLYDECLSRGKDKCKSDKNCELFGSTCLPSLIGTMDLLNKKDCQNVQENDYANMLKKLSVQEKEIRIKKDASFFLQSIKNIDTSGCGVVSLNMMETLYGTKMK